MNNKIIISVFGSGKAKPGEDLFELAQSVGRFLAGGGYVIANGGYGGTMLATAKGASHADGEVVGVTCRAFGRSKANEYVTEVIETAELAERLGRLVELGQAYVFLPGGTGTLLELAEVWELKNKGLADSSKPIIMVGEFWKPLVELITGIQPASRELVDIVASPEEMMRVLTEHFSA